MGRVRVGDKPMYETSVRQEGSKRLHALTRKGKGWREYRRKALLVALIAAARVSPRLIDTPARHRKTIPAKDRKIKGSCPQWRNATDEEKKKGGGSEGTR